jgi:hypothetical protein
MECYATLDDGFRIEEQKWEVATATAARDSLQISAQKFRRIGCGNHGIGTCGVPRVAFLGTAVDWDLSTRTALLGIAIAATLSRARAA